MIPRAQRGAMGSKTVERVGDPSREHIPLVRHVSGSSANVRHHQYEPNGIKTRTLPATDRAREEKQ